MLAYVFFKPIEVEFDYEEAVYSDKADALTTFSSPLEQAFKDIKQWAELEAMGRCLCSFGNEISIQIPIAKLEELSKFLLKFEPTTQRCFAVGVGMTPEEARKAMVISENEMGERVIMYSPEMEANDQVVEKAYYGQDFGNDFTLDLPGIELDKDAEPEYVEDSPPDEPAKDLMPGGKGDNMPDSKFDPKQLEEGTKQEMQEHGLDEQRAKEISKDHLSEKPDYYSKEDGQEQSKESEDQPEKEKKSIKQKVMETLMMVKQNSDAIAQLKSIKPEAFRAVKSAIDAMILMAQSEMQKSERSEESSKVEEEETKPPSKNKKKLAKEEPVGTIKNHRIKVQARDEATREIKGEHWHKVSDGMIMGATGHPISPNKPAKE